MIHKYRLGTPSLQI